MLLTPSQDTNGTRAVGSRCTSIRARVAETQAVLARVPAVLDGALGSVAATGLTVEQFRKASSVSTTLGSDLSAFSVKNSDPRRATLLATAYAEAFTEYTHSNDTGATAQVVREADLAEKIAPRTVRNGAIAVVLGILLALGVAFLADALDTRVRSVDVVRDVLGIPLLGQLPPPSKKMKQGGALVMLDDPISLEAESFRTSRVNLSFANAHHKARVLMITSAADDEGKSTTAANLAIALARGGRSVVLIDADLRSPHLHRLFDLPEKPGLTDIALGDVALDVPLREIQIRTRTSAAAGWASSASSPPATRSTIRTSSVRRWRSRESSGRSAGRAPPHPGPCATAPASRRRRRSQRPRPGPPRRRPPEEPPHRDAERAAADPRIDPHGEARRDRHRGAPDGGAPVPPLRPASRPIRPADVGTSQGRSAGGERVGRAVRARARPPRT